MKVAPEKLPVAPVVVEPPSVTLVPAKVAVTALLAPNPVPLIVTVSFDPPLVATRVILGATVRVALAEFAEASVTETVWLPVTLAGAVKVAEKLPEVSEVGAAGVSPTVTPS